MISIGASFPYLSAKDGKIVARIIVFIFERNGLAFGFYFIS